MTKGEIENLKKRNVECTVLMSEIYDVLWKEDELKKDKARWKKRYEEFVFEGMKEVVE